MVLGLATGIANADFVFGTPENLGPLINSSIYDATPCISVDELSLYFTSARPGGSGKWDIWVSTRATMDDPWGEPENLGPVVNSSAKDFAPCISADELSLYFTSDRPGGLWGWDIWVSTRATTDDPWEEPENLGPVVNSSAYDSAACISADGLELFLCSRRSGGLGSDDIYVSTRVTPDDPWGKPVNLSFNNSAKEGYPSISSDRLTLFFASFKNGGLGEDDLWMTTRPTKDDDWGIPVNLGLPVNTSGHDGSPSISADGTTLYFYSDTPDGIVDVDLWQTSLEPIVDLNADGIVDALDMCIIVDHWGTDDSLCDIGPMPFGDGVVDVQDLIVLAEGDGVVDVQDLIVLAEHLFESVP